MGKDESAAEKAQEADADFEAKVAALLKVDPKGIAGKHRKEKDAKEPENKG